MGKHDKESGKSHSSQELSRRQFLTGASTATAVLILSRGGSHAQDDPYPTITDSKRDFSGVQGFHGWYYGYSPERYLSSSFREMRYFAPDELGSPSWFADPVNYLTKLNAEGGFPNGAGEILNISEAIQLPIRRWISYVADKAELVGSFALRSPTDTTDGVVGSIYADGRLLWTRRLTFDSPVEGFEVELRLSVGTVLDFVVEPGASVTGDAFNFQSKIGRGGCRNCCHADPPVRYTQGQLPWGAQTYDHKTPEEGRHTIGHVGCALTSLSMALYYAGYPNDPGTLNELLIQPESNGYEPVSHNVRWDDAVRAVSRRFGKNLRWVRFQTSNPQRLDEVLCGGQDPGPGVFWKGYPVIIGVQRHPSPTMPFNVDHFVLAVVMRADSITGEPFYFIIDPANRTTTNLAAYPQFASRGYVVDPPGAFSGLNLDVANASLLVTDSYGGRTGYDVTAGSIVEIPNSAAYGDSLAGDITDTPAESFSSYVTIQEPESQVFTIRVTGVTGSEHTVSIRGYSSDGTPQPEVRVPVNVAPGESVDLDVNYSVEPGSTPEVGTEVELLIQRKVNLTSEGVVPVYVISNGSFDARSVDPLSLRLGPAGAREVHGKGHPEDINGDGLIDLGLHFRVQELGLAESDIRVCLTGKTYAGNTIRGCSPITVLAR